MPLDRPGTQDITVEVPSTSWPASDRPIGCRARPSSSLRHGIDELVEEGRRVWAERAAVGDLAALPGRSRVREAEALIDPAGLGGFSVVEWVVRGPAGSTL